MSSFTEFLEEQGIDVGQLQKRTVERNIKYLEKKYPHLKKHIKLFKPKPNQKGGS